MCESILLENSSVEIIAKDGNRQILGLRLYRAGENVNK